MNQIVSISQAETALGKVFAAQGNAADQVKRFELFSEIGLPHPRDENWRWTDLHGAITKFTKTAVATKSDTCVTLDGVTQTEFVSKKNDPISLLAAGLSTDNSIAGFVIDRTTDQVLKLKTNCNSTLGGSLVQIRVKSGCSVVLIEDNNRASNGFAVNSREFIVEGGATLTRVLVNQHSSDQVRVNQAFVEVGENGCYHQYTLDFGAHLSRNQTHISLLGDNTNIAVNGAYLLSKSSKSDMISVISHQALSGVTRQLVKGVVFDQAKAVFQGKFHVAKSAQRTDAKMGHHTILLGDAARVQAKPELEIYADDVACAHGNTVGALDDAALFYMRQRGLSKTQARALLIRAFVVETLDKLPADIAKDLTAYIDDWLEERQ